MLLGGQRVDDPDLEARLGEGTLDGAVSVPSVDDHDDIRSRPVPGRSEDARSSKRSMLGVLNLGGWDEDAAVKIGEHPFGPKLGTIDTDDTEVLRSDPLDTGTDHATSLVDGLGSGSGGRFLDLGCEPWERPPGKSLGRRPTPPQEVGMALRVRIKNL